MKSTDIFSHRHNILFKKLISKSLLSQLITSKTRFRIFDPVTTLHLFLYQILRGVSNKGALSYFNVLRLSRGEKTVSMNTAAYTKAKYKLNESVLRKIAISSGGKIDEESKQWFWKNKRAYLIDGTVLNLEDTDKISKEYPKTFSRGKPQGQPKLRLLGAFSLSSGAFIDGELGKYSGKGQAETTLVRELIKRLQKDSVLVLDRFFTSFYLQDIFLRSGFDYIIRGRDKSMKRILGRSTDKVVTLKRPGLRKNQTYNIEEASEEIKVRIIKSSLKRKGFRTSVLYFMTSFTNKKEYQKKELEEMYLSRWNVELDIRHIKTTMQSSLLKSKSPSMLRKELWTILIGFNLIRAINNITAHLKQGLNPRKLSFKTALNSYLEVMIRFKKLNLNVLKTILSNEVLKSKYRREPRALKNRTVRYSYLTKPRNESKKENWGYSRRSGGMGLQTNWEV